MERSIKKYYQTRTISLYKRTFYTLKDTIIVFSGIEKIQLLKYGYQLRVSEIPVYRIVTSKKLNNRHYIERHTKTGHQKRFPVFLRSFLAFSKIASIAPCKGVLERNLLSRLANPQAVRGGRAKRKSVLFIWQFSIFGGVGNERKMKKFSKIPAYSGL